MKNKTCNVALLLAIFLSLGFPPLSFAQDSTYKEDADNQVKSETIKNTEPLSPIDTKPSVSPRERIKPLQSDRAVDIRSTIKNSREGVEIKTEMEQRREDRTDPAEQRYDRDEKLNDVRKNRIRLGVAVVVKRISSAIERIDNIADRLRSRIEKISESRNNIDFSLALGKLDEVDKHLTVAKSTLEEIKSLIEIAIDSDDQKRAFETIKTLVHSAQQSLRDAHKALKEAFRLAKEAVGDEDEPSGAINANDNSSLVDDDSTKSDSDSDNDN
jgi:hypothetical protein